MKVRSCVAALSCALVTPAFAGEWVYTLPTAQVHLMPDAFHPGAESEARDVNNAGQIVGWSNTSAGVANAWLYDTNGVYKHVGIPLLTTYSAALGINNHGEVVGAFDSGSNGRAFYWHSSTGFSPLGIELQAAFPYNYQYVFRAYAINDHGKIVGSADAPGPGTDIPYDKCYWDLPISWNRADSQPRKLYCPAYPNGENEARGVNNLGMVAGFETTSLNRAFRFHNGAVKYVPWPIDGLHDGMGGYGINQKGAVAGYGMLPYQGGRAIYWDGVSEASRPLGVLPGGSSSRGHDVNDQDFVTGWSEATISTEAGVFPGKRAFLWHDHFGMVGLPMPPPSRGPLWTACEANALNNFQATSGSQGKIRVVGFCKRGDLVHAVRWEVTVTRWWIP
jgi:probable HAF family extracellular repeat protein